MIFNALIVDDEKLARERLKDLLSRFKETITVIDEAPDSETALKIIKNKPIDVIFLDIQMPGMTGIELAEKLPDNIYVIFTTAYDEYALKAFEANTIDYLLKPIEVQRLKKAIEKLNRYAKDGFTTYRNQMQSLLNAFGKKKSSTFTVKVGDKAIFLNYDDIIYFQADDKYITIKTHDHQYYISDTINSLEDRLPGDKFCRCHRGAIVNLNQIKEAQKWFAGKYQLVMKDKNNSIIPLSRNLKNCFGL